MNSIKARNWLHPWVADVRIPDLIVHAITTDSRQVTRGSAFIAVRGRSADGMDFAHQAEAAGACLVLCAPRENLPRLTIPIVQIANLEEHVGPIAARFYGDPADHLRIVGMTGTNGKTSCAHFLSQAWSASGRGCGGFIGTLGWGNAERWQEGTHTTPDALHIQRQLAALRQQKNDLVAMEVSSHALDQERVHGLSFAATVLTNISRDHLDYHGDMATYKAAKMRLFTDYSSDLTILNADDAFSAEIEAAVGGDRPCISYSLAAAPAAQVHGDIQAIDGSGIQLQLQTPWGQGVVKVGVLGRFQAGNLLATVATLGGLGCDFGQITQALRALRPVPGRMQPVPARQAGRPLVLVDYAHTPDALKHALSAARELTSGRLWCVFGCGGGRDRGKRPLMGAAAARLADQVVLTSDNPRLENPGQILREIAVGVAAEHHPAVAHVKMLEDRASAIAWAIRHGAADDVILVAGKGHEPYQDIGGEKRPFDDVHYARRALESAA